MCKKYAEFVYVTIPDGKGSQDRYDTCSAVEPLIVNGEDAMPREYPHMVGSPLSRENPLPQPGFREVTTTLTYNSHNIQGFRKVPEYLYIV